MGENPTRLSLQPEATGATVEVTKRLKPPVKRAAKYGGSASCTGRNVSERRASLEKDVAQADPTTLSGKADMTVRKEQGTLTVAVPG